MAVKSLQLMSEEYVADTDNKRTYTRKYAVIHELADTVYSVLTSAVFPLPKIGDAHPDDIGCWVQSVRIVEAGPETRVKFSEANTSHMLRDVLVTYTNNDSSGLATATRYSRERGAYNVSLDLVTYQDTLRQGTGSTATTPETVTTRKAAFNQKIVNGAGEFIRVETTKRNTLLRFDFDTRTYQAAWQVKFVGSCNSAAITIAGYSIAAEQGKLLKFCPTTLFDSYGVEYYSVSVEVEIEYDMPVRYKDVLNAGYKFRASAGATPQDIYTDGAGNYGAKSTTLTQKITEPYPLTAAGLLLTGWPAVDENYVRVYDTWLSDWAALGLPDKAKERRNNR